MAASNNLDKLSYAELAEMRVRIDRLMIEKQNAARVELRQKITALAKEHGFDVHELLDGRRMGKGKGSVAPKYRDPKNPENTWSGRGRMPRWLVAATKGGKAKREEFLI